MTPDRCFLRVDTMGNPPTVDISSELFNALSHARTVLSGAFVIEQLYEGLIRSYTELEQEIMTFGTVSMLTTPSSYESFFEPNIAVNLRVAYFLTATRMYQDQVAHRIVDCGVPLSVFKALCSAQYDSHFEYRFMEALRNYVQHQGLAVHSCSTGGRWTSIGSDGHQEFSVKVQADRERFATGSIKASVLAELPDKIDVRAAARVYLACVIDVHQEIRNQIALLVQNARAAIEEAHALYRQHHHSVVGLFAWQELGDVQKKVLLILDWDDVRRRLEKTNVPFANLRRAYLLGQ